MDRSPLRPDPERHPIDRAMDRHGIHDVAGPFLAGGVDLLGQWTGLGRDLGILYALTDESRLRAYLHLRERLLQIAVAELVSLAKSPVDVFSFIAQDGDQFHAGYVDHVIKRHTRHDGTSSLLQPAADDDVTTITGADNKKASIRRYLPDSHIHRVENGETLLYRQFCAAQRHSAYQKLLVKLDFIQPDSDPEDVLERLKSSTRWSGLEDDRELRYYLKRHMDFLKKYDKSQMGTAYSTSEYENAVSEKINSELSSRLQNDLERSDWMIMQQYYGRMMLRRIARECAIQAQTIGVILVGEAIPKNPEVRMLPLIQRIQGKFGTFAAAGRPWQLLALGILATVATARHQG